MPLTTTSKTMRKNKTMTKMLDEFAEAAESQMTKQEKKPELKTEEDGLENKLQGLINTIGQIKAARPSGSSWSTGIASQAVQLQTRMGTPLIAQDYSRKVTRVAQTTHNYMFKSLPEDKLLSMLFGNDYDQRYFKFEFIDNYSKGTVSIIGYTNL